MILKILTKFIKGNQKITPPLSEQFSNNHPHISLKVALLSVEFHRYLPPPLWVLTPSYFSSLALKVVTQEDSQ